ncbi:hypothetical protein [Vreelandella venusta]|uniref:hypothetical protein n=1 Tax=Vreelandella venusta TaxID=44935 RepID=UPI00200DCD85|nr:hypothetical protein [Halomonas venusta]UQI42530.1 hypothetical protein M3L73_09800 [Halomonas venusta]
MKDNWATLCWPNYLNEATLSGGSWRTDLPRENLQQPIFDDIAETMGLGAANTQFDVILPRFRTVALVALAKHNLTVAARWRVRLFRDEMATNEMWDSGWRDVWPSVYSSSELNWEDPNFWSGGLFEEDRQDFTSLAWMFADAPQVCRRVRVEIDNPTNPEGAVRIGRAFIANYWQPTYNASWGIQYGLDIGTEFENADNQDMTEYADAKTPRRTVSFELAHITRDESFAQIHAMLRRQGLHQEILYTESRAPGPQTFAKTFIGRLASVDPLTNPYFANFTNSITLREIL